VVTGFVLLLRGYRLCNDLVFSPCEILRLLAIQGDEDTNAQEFTLIIFFASICK